MKINIDIITSYLLKYQDEIMALIDNTIPAMIMELKAEEAELSKLSTAWQLITEIDEQTIIKVFDCWMSTADGAGILEEMKKVQNDINTNAVSHVDYATEDILLP